MVVVVLIVVVVVVVVVVSAWNYGTDQAGTAMGVNLHEAPKRYWHHRKYGASELGFNIRKNFFENYPQSGYAPSKTFASPVLGLKCLADIGFKGRKIITLPGDPNC
jgi:hypothetical protein